MSQENAFGSTLALVSSLVEKGVKEGLLLEGVAAYGEYRARGYTVEDAVGVLLREGLVEGLHMNTIRVKKPIPVVTFAQCNGKSDHFQFWQPNNSIIYSKCIACGTITSYSSEGSFVAYHDHYTFYEIALVKKRGEEWGDHWKRAEQLVRADPKKYLKVS